MEGICKGYGLGRYMKGAPFSVKGISLKMILIFSSVRVISWRDLMLIVRDVRDSLHDIFLAKNHGRL